ncbi:hypothetical protein KQH61_05480 [bacterium]|nr:hypothetical protein [bacterium]MCB2179353.1 hypothetical protein [bacterium]
MNRAQKIIEAYRNTPWRRQMQMLGLFAAFAVVATVVMIVYVWVTSLAGAYGLQVQEYQETTQALEKVIEDKNAHLAELTSVENLAARAEEKDYQVVDPNRLRYLEVEGYPAEGELQLAPSTSASQDADSEQLPASYTTSLIDWVREMIFKLSLQTGAAGIGGE